MYEVRCLNEKGERFSKCFTSEYFMRKFVEKAKRGHKLIIVSYGKVL